jgi:hypothetical protein
MLKACDGGGACWREAFRERDCQIVRHEASVVKASQHQALVDAGSLKKPSIKTYTLSNEWIGIRVGLLQLAIGVQSHEQLEKHI